VSPGRSDALPGCATTTPDDLDHGNATRLHCKLELCSSRPFYLAHTRLVSSQKYASYQKPQPYVPIPYETPVTNLFV
jgi:hypothetical protein